MPWIDNDRICVCGRQYWHFLHLAENHGILASAHPFLTMTPIETVKPW